MFWFHRVLTKKWFDNYSKHLNIRDSGSHMVRFLNGGLKTRQKMSALWSKMSDIQNGLPNHVIKPFENQKKIV